jgi:hypothetical protein
MARVLVFVCAGELTDLLLTEGIATTLSWFEPTNVVMLAVAPDEDPLGAVRGSGAAGAHQAP